MYSLTCDGELQKDPYDSLVKIEELANLSNEVDKTTAVSIAFLMKSIGASLNASGADFSQWCDLIPDDNVVYEVCQILFGQEYSANATFWLVLETLEVIFIKFLKKIKKKYLQKLAKLLLLNIYLQKIKIKKD